MALDLLKNIKMFIDYPVGKNDAQKLKETLELLENEYIARLVKTSLLEDKSLIGAINDALINLHELEQDIIEKLGVIEEKTKETEFLPPEQDSEVLDVINNIIEQNARDEHKQIEQEKKERRGKLERVRGYVEQEIKRMEELEINPLKSP